MLNMTTGKGIRTAGMIKAGIVNWWKEYRKSKIGVVGLILFAILIIALIFGTVIATHDPRQMVVGGAQPPSTEHLVGVDIKGRDLFSMLLYGGRVSVGVGLLTATIVISTATIVGLFAGYFGGIIDELLMRIADILMVLPRLPLLIVMATFLNPGIGTIIFIIAVLGWTRPARQIRALTLSLKQYGYVESTRASGAGPFHIIFHHILPNVSGVIVAQFVMEVVAVILMETGLSFLGFGDPRNFSWGQILYWSQTYGAFINGQWWWWLPPGLCITVMCFSMAFIGTTLNDRFVLRLNYRGKE